MYQYTFPEEKESPLAKKTKQSKREENKICLYTFFFLIKAAINSLILQYSLICTKRGRGHINY